MSRNARPLPRVRAAVVDLPLRTGRVVRYLPSGRAVVIGLALAALAALAYFGARETSVFAIRRIEVVGTSPMLARQVRAALQPLDGESLLKLHAGEVSRLATALPQIESASYDRSFPNTLRVRVEAEQPLAILRRGNEWWLVSRRGRVMARLTPRRSAALPRIWVTKQIDIALGGTLAGGGGSEEIGALLPLRAAGFRSGVETVRIAKGQVTYVLRGGLELRVGTMDNLTLKLAVARQILRQTAVTGYLDVSVPQRPVASTNHQVSG